MSPTSWSITADYLENCNCELLCPCLFAVKPTYGDCRVPIAYHIREGHYGDVRLDDRTVVFAVTSSGSVRGHVVTVARDSLTRDVEQLLSALNHVADTQGPISA